ncbi:uncharacterized protein DS421_10g308560 [Arachis hypogaea]|nr:uncharacterized protein DS421_10g308560 [Arachis hypogaea]
MMKIVILLSLLVTNGFSLSKSQANVVPQQRDCPGGCNFLIPVCAPRFPVCINGFCSCGKLDNNNNNNNNVSTKQERHNNGIDSEKQN